MPSCFKYVLALLCFAILCNSTKAKTEDNKLRNNELAYLTFRAEGELSTAFEQGLHTFWFELEELDGNIRFCKCTEPEALAHSLKAINSYSKQTNIDKIKLLFTGNYNSETLKKVLQKNLKDSFLVLNSGEFSHISEDKKMKCLLNENLLLFSDTAKLEKYDFNQPNYKHTNSFTLLNTENIESDSLRSFCLKAWFNTGCVPNFVVINENNIANAFKDLRWLNSLRRFRGEIRFEDQILNGINWKQLPGTITPGKFSFPLTDYSLVLSPYKNGYLITPGEIIHHTAMEDNTRQFIAHRSGFDDGLTYHFTFNKEAKNVVEQTNNSTIVNDVKWISDEKRGNVAEFNTQNSYIDYTKPNQLNMKTPISMSVWLKPKELTPYMGIIGIGTSFSFKLKDGQPDFTAAQIQDHIVPSTLKTGEWTMLGFIFNPGGTIDFFINGKKVKSIKASSIQESDQSLVIGNNIWGEQYLGLMDELMIWDRGLSEYEFELLYEQQVHPSNKAWLWWLLIIPIVVLMWFVGTYKNRNKTHAPKLSTNNNKATPHIRTTPTENTIELLGSFNIESKTHGNITSSFSPLLKQLLSFIVIRTVFSNGSGVTTKEINNVFWPGFTKEQAKDNRGTNIKKIRTLLAKLPGTQITFTEKKWQFICDDNSMVDVFLFQELKNQMLSMLEAGQLDLTLTQEFIAILHRGNLLQQMDNEWLDTYKAQLTDEVSRILLQSEKLISNHYLLKTDLAKTILLFDDLNEEALVILIQSLTKMGNHGLAQQTFAEFSKRYENLYNEAFFTDFNSIANQNNTNDT